MLTEIYPALYATTQSFSWSGDEGLTAEEFNARAAHLKAGVMRRAEDYLAAQTPEARAFIACPTPDGDGLFDILLSEWACYNPASAALNYLYEPDAPMGSPC